MILFPPFLHLINSFLLLKRGSYDTDYCICINQFFIWIWFPWWKFDMFFVFSPLCLLELAGTVAILKQFHHLVFGHHLSCHPCRSKNQHRKQLAWLLQIRFRSCREHFAAHSHPNQRRSHCGKTEIKENWNCWINQYSRGGSISISIQII